MSLIGWDTLSAPMTLIGIGPAAACAVGTAAKTAATDIIRIDRRQMLSICRLI